MNILSNTGSSNNFVWVAPERTASRATYDAMVHNGVTVATLSGESQQAYRKYNHERYKLINYPTSAYQIIYNVRNPYAQIPSVWRRQQVDYQSFIESNYISSISGIVNTVLNSTSLSLSTVGLSAAIPVFTPSKYYTFNSYVTAGSATGKYFFRKNYPTFIRGDDSIFTVRTENLSGDLLKIPFIKTLPVVITNNETRFTEIRSAIVKNFILNSLKYGSIDKNYYIDFFNKNNLTSPNATSSRQGSFFVKFYEFLNQSDSYISNVVSQVASCFSTGSDFVSGAQILDLNHLYSPTSALYDQQLADTIYNARSDWFNRFGYEKDSWKTLL